MQDANGAKGVDVGGKPKEKKQKKQSTRQEEAAAAEAEKQRQAQLELLLMDDRALQDAVRLGEVHLICGRFHLKSVALDVQRLLLLCRP